MELWELPPPFYESIESYHELWEEEMATTKEVKEIVTEIKTTLVGIEGTADQGLVGTVKEIEKHIKEQNTRITKNESRSKTNRKLLYIIVVSAMGGAGGLATWITKIAELW